MSASELSFFFFDKLLLPRCRKKSYAYFCGAGVENMQLTQIITLRAQILIDNYGSKKLQKYSKYTFSKITCKESIKSCTKYKLP